MAEPLTPSESLPPSVPQRDDAVGYGRPPRHSRFAKGQSGNPKGRPGGAKNFSTLLTEALNELVASAESGARRKISRCQVIIKQLVKRAEKGDWRAAKLLLDFQRENERRTQPETSESWCDTEDRKTIEEMTARLRGKKVPSDD